MYEELVKMLRCQRIGCGDCSMQDMKLVEADHTYHVYAQYCIAHEAADAIEELSAKATPKRVGFDGWKGCRNTRYKCPYCKKNVRNDETYCHKCGQSLMFPRISYTPYVPGEKQELIVTWPDEPPKEET